MAKSSLSSDSSQFTKGTKSATSTSISSMPILDNDVASEDDEGNEVNNELSEGDEDPYWGSYRERSM